MNDRTPENEARRWYELWQLVEGGVNQASKWMVWEVGPMSGGEHWFTTEEEAREFIDERVAEKVAA